MTRATRATGGGPAGGRPGAQPRLESHVEEAMGTVFSFTLAPGGLTADAVRGAVRASRGYNTNPGFASNPGFA